MLYTLLLGDRLARSPPAREAGRFFSPVSPGGARERRLPAQPRGVRVQVLHTGHRHPRGGK
nr:MAG TPA: hypothetical protein [Caudoviricetes sp.]